MDASQPVVHHGRIATISWVALLLLHPAYYPMLWNVIVWRERSRFCFCLLFVCLFCFVCVYVLLSSSKRPGLFLFGAYLGFALHGQTFFDFLIFIYFLLLAKTDIASLPSQPHPVQNNTTSNKKNNNNPAYVPVNLPKQGARAFQKLEAQNIVHV